MKMKTSPTGGSLHLANVELFLRRLRFGVFPAEALHAACGIDQFLFPGKKRMAIGTNFHVDIALVG